MMHSEEFKKAAVQKFLTRGNRTVLEIAEELGINQATIYQWRKHFAIRSDMKKNTKPESRSVSEKLKAVAEYNTLTSEKRGEYLRKSGLYEDNIIEWQKQIEEALSPKKKSRLDAQELFAEQKKVKQLTKELHRKEKALAEAAALLILKKKADLIWGSEEDE